jgi:hypothetical protein
MNSNLATSKQSPNNSSQFFFSYVYNNWTILILLISLTWISKFIIDLSLLAQYFDFSTLIGLIAFWHASKFFHKNSNAPHSSLLQTSRKYSFTYPIMAAIIIAFGLLPAAFESHLKEVPQVLYSLPFLSYAILFLVVPFLARPFVDFMLFRAVDTTISPRNLIRDAWSKVSIRNWTSLTLTPVFIVFTSNLLLQTFWRTSFKTFLLECAKQNSEVDCASRFPLFLLKDYSSLSYLQLVAVILLSIVFVTLHILTQIIVASICKRIEESRQS